MLQGLNINETIDDDSYDMLYETMSLRLNELHRLTREKQLGTVIIFHGWHAAGKGTILNRVLLNLDPRSYFVSTPSTKSEDERMRPYLWPWWIRSPEKGRLHIFEGGWYRGLKVRDDERIRAINEFEQMLTADGVLVIKFFFHISSREQKKRFQELSRSPSQAWRLDDSAWKEHANYAERQKRFNSVLELTHREHAAWECVSSEDTKSATISVMETLIQAWEKMVDPDLEHPGEHDKPEPAPAPKLVKPVFIPTFLKYLDLKQECEEESYRSRLHSVQKELRSLEFRMYQSRLPVVVAFEGCDAAGKGGAIKRLCQSLDPRGYRVHPIAAPTEEERKHHYLWRFWRCIPKDGHLAIFDRSWYGRVLVERVEGFASEEAWNRAYGEIAAFERHLAEEGALILKFWLQIDKEEQLKRFKEREATPYKNYKITPEDWRNREKWNDYQAAVDEMVFRTDTPFAPWVLVPANSKYHARLFILETIAQQIRRALERRN